MSPRTLRPCGRHAFTLIELMVSIFLLMLVMVGVNTVFSTTSATVGTNTAISSINRDARAFQSTLNRDFVSTASDSACMIIRCEQLFQFQNARDYNADADKLASTADFTGSGIENTVSPMLYGQRSHRLDRISFFTRQLLQRQTGNDGVFVANQTTSEQWTWIGHLRLGNNTNYTAMTLGADFPGPGEGSLDGSVLPKNPNNFFAESWSLGRVAIGLSEPVPPASGNVPGVIMDSKNVSQDYIYRSTTAAVTSLSPLATGSTSTQIAGSRSYDIQESRYDLAGTSIGGYRTILNSVIAAQPSNAWWVTMLGGPGSRFLGMPYANRPLSSEAVSKLAPVLLGNASSFTVEYAGDFVKQDPTTGAVTDAYETSDETVIPATKYTGSTDGEIDFNIPTTGPLIGQRMIRWYGFPRGTSGATTVSLTNGDVCPVRDTIRSAGGTFAGTKIFAPFERTGGSGGVDILASNPRADYTGLTGTGGYRYVCAWAPTDTVRPKLIRIIVTIEDPTGRMQNGQTYEYVFALQ